MIEDVEELRRGGEEISEQAQDLRLKGIDNTDQASIEKASKLKDISNDALDLADNMDDAIAS